LTESGRNSLNPKTHISSFILLAILAIIVCAFYVSPLLGTAGLKDGPPETIDLFAGEVHPGTGTLVYRQGAKVELIELGAQSGHYGLGIVFHSSALPEAFQKEFQNTHIIQIVLGTMTSKLQEQVPEFGGISLITKKIPSHPQIFNTKLRTAASSDILNLGLMLVTSPSTPREQVDEQKLKSTYFAQSGTIILTPLETFRPIQTDNAGTIIKFRTQTVRLEFNNELATPFSGEKAELQGKLEIPLYWPDGKPAELFAKKIANRSLAGMSAPPSQPPTGITRHNRNLAGSTKKDAAPTNGQ